MKKLKRLALLIAGCISVCGCILPETPDDTVRMNETQPVLHGKLLKSDEKTPVKGALVTIQTYNATVPIGDNTTSNGTHFKQITYTNNSGYFSFDTCDSGLYVIEAVDSSGKEAVRTDPVVVSENDSSIEIPSSVLKKTGILKGRILLDKGGNPANCFVLVLGSDRFVQADSNGFFSMNNLPYGNYTLRVVCLLEEYSSSQTAAITVQPDTIVNAGTITLQAQGICIPQNLTLYYDSIKDQVHIQWDLCLSSPIKGYNIYRSYANSDYWPGSPLNNVVITANHFVDSTNLPNKKYFYTIAAIAHDGTIGRKTVHQQICTSVSYIIDTLEQLPGITPERVYWKDDTIPLALYHQNGDLVIIEYNADNTISQRTNIALPFDVLQTACIDNNNIFAIERPQESYPESSEVFCYFPDGSLRFKCVIDGEISMFDVNNDTLYVFEDMRKGGVVVHLAKAYSTTGNLLFTINDPKSSKEDVLFHCASDGYVYTIHITVNKTEIKRRIWNTGNAITCKLSTSMKSPILIDATGHLLLISNWVSDTPDAELLNDSGQVLYDFKENPFNEKYNSIEKFFNRPVAMNSRGEILMIRNGTLCIMSLPVDLTAWLNH